MGRKRCASCGQPFRPRPHIPQQRYCPEPACQRERRRQWQQTKRLRDPEYRDNEAKARRAWGQRNPDYWRDYRRSHPEYVARNRAGQSLRNGNRRGGLIANGDARTRDSRVPSGIYQLRPVAAFIANGDVCTVEIVLLSIGTAFSPHCKERTL
ncbi:MAG: hypothetical protein P4L83_03650 [Nevskia sp.]|nr:hypothetical protein [Nevskia sp.]